MSGRGNEIPRAVARRCIKTRSPDSWSSGINGEDPRNSRTRSDVDVPNTTGGQLLRQPSGRRRLSVVMAMAAAATCASIIRILEPALRLGSSEHFRLVVGPAPRKPLPHRQDAPVAAPCHLPSRGHQPSCRSRSVLLRSPRTLGAATASIVIPRHDNGEDRSTVVRVRHCLHAATAPTANTTAARPPKIGFTGIPVVR